MFCNERLDTDRTYPPGRLADGQTVNRTRMDQFGEEASSCRAIQSGIKTLAFPKVLPGIQEIAMRAARNRENPDNTAAVIGFLGEYNLATEGTPVLTN